MAGPRACHLCARDDRILLTKDRQLGRVAREAVSVLLLAGHSINENACELRGVLGVNWQRTPFTRMPQLIFALHQYGRSLGVDAIIIDRYAHARSRDLVSGVVLGVLTSEGRGE